MSPPYNEPPDRQIIAIDAAMVSGQLPSCLRQLLARTTFQFLLEKIKIILFYLD